jgi:hypothetical protein
VALRSWWRCLAGQHQRAARGTRKPSGFLLFNTAPGPGARGTRVTCCWIDQQAAKLTPSK